MPSEPKRRRPKLTRVAVNLALSAVPEDLVRQVATAGAPLSRFGGRSAGAARTLGRALRALATPPAKLRRPEEARTLEAIAKHLDRPEADVRAWARAGMLGERGPQGWDRRAVERARLIDHLLRRGTPVEELERAAGEGRLGNLILAHALGGGHLTLAEVGERSGLPEELVLAVWRALGLAPGGAGDAIYNEGDLEALRLLGALRGIFPDEDLVEAASVMGRAMSEIARSSLELFRRRLAVPFQEAGVGELELALRLAGIQELLVPATGVLLESALRRHLEAAGRQDASLELERQAGDPADQARMAIGFVDIVGFTALSTRQTPLQVSTLATTLLRCAEEVFARRGVQLVKSIGDAVMLAARDTPAAALAAIELGEAFAARAGALAAGGGIPEAPPPLRTGIAEGPVLRAYADFFGRTVNVASRLSDLAGPGEVLALVPDPGPDWRAAGLRASRPRALELNGIDGAVPTVTLAAVPHAAAGPR